MVIPFLILLVLGIVDTAFLVTEQLEVRAAAREGGRHAATIAGDTNFVVGRVCEHFDSGDIVSISLSGASGALGDELELTVAKQTEPITGLTDVFFNPPVTLSSTATFRIERLPVPWSDSVGEGCP